MKFVLCIVVFFIFLGTANPLFGNPTDCQSIFKKVYQESYRENNCDKNILELLRHFQNTGIDISTTLVHIFFIPGETLISLNSRMGWSEWKYHVVLEHQGKIYDFDHGSDLTIDDKKTHFDKHFASQNPLWGLKDQKSKIRTLTVPGPEYLTSPKTIEEWMNQPQP